MPLLFVMRGPQASGKTTRSKKMCEDHPEWHYICSDLYFPIDDEGKRYWFDEQGNKRCWYTDPLPTEVEDRAYYWAYQQLIAAMDAQKDKLYEGTLVDRHSRKKIINEAKARDYEVSGFFLFPSLLICAQRNSCRTHPVPDIVLARTYAKIEIPDLVESMDYKDVQVILED